MGRLRRASAPRVENPFHLIKNLLHKRKPRYHGLANNHPKLIGLFGQANLLIATVLVLMIHG
jgi:hypothetical protein